MPNGDRQPYLDEESFARAWATGDEYERGRMIYRIGYRGIEAKQMVKRHLAYIYGGIAVVSVVAAPILLTALNILGGE